MPFPPTSIPPHELSPPSFSQSYKIYFNSLRGHGVAQEARPQRPSPQRYNRSGSRERRMIKGQLRAAPTLCSCKESEKIRRPSLASGNRHLPPALHPLAIPLCPIMRLAEHLAVLRRSATPLAPWCHMIRLHLLQLIYARAVRIFTRRAERAV